MSDSKLSTRPLPSGVTAIPVWGRVLREDGTHRDRMKLTWTSWLRQHKPPTLIIGMNPSGGGIEADATLIKNWEFVNRWTGGPMIMMNVIACRATKPKEMRFDPDAMRQNKLGIVLTAQEVMGAGGKVVVMWGNPSLPKDKLALFQAEADEIVADLKRMGANPLCLGHNENGSPKHSLMLAYETPLVPYVP